jgi:hypothetical protein
MCKSVTVSARLVLVAAALQGQFSGNFSLWHPVLPAVLKPSGPSLARRTNFRQHSQAFTVQDFKSSRLPTVPALWADSEGTRDASR